MIHLEIPYWVENDRINKEVAKQEIMILNLSDEEKSDVFRAIYHVRPRMVSFNTKDAEKINKLQQTLVRLGVPYRRIED